MHRRFLRVSRLLLLLFVTGAGAQERLLIEGGRSDYEIVCALEANAATSLAARELQTWIRQSTGLELPQVSRPTQGRNHFFIGENEWSAIAGVTAEGLNPEGYRLKTVGADIHLVGRDLLRGSLSPKRTSATQTGSLSGVCDFLERCLGIRFLWHDKLGTLVPKRDRIIVPDLDIETAPAWSYRRLAYSPEEKCGDDLFGRRLRLGHSHTVAHSHAWFQIMPVETYGKEHPEWFAEIDGERRTAYYMEHHGGQVCTSNPEVVEVFAKAAIAFFDEQPGRDMFSLSPNDGSGFCTCEKCRALDHGGTSLTDRLITFYNAIAERVDVKYPDKLLGAYAYSYYRDPPVTVKVHPNLYVVHATNTAFHQGLGWPEEHAAEEQWRASAPHLAKYDIYYSPDSSLNLIAPVTKHLVEKIRAESATGIEGGYLYIGQSYEQLGAGHFLMARLMWDPAVDTATLAAGYYRSLYGDAAVPVQSYYDLLESRLIQAKFSPLDMSLPAVRVALRKHPGPGSTAYILSAYEPILDEASALMETAKAGDLNADERDRLQRLLDQHELLLTTVRGMFVAARLESDARSNADDAKTLLALIGQRQAVRERLKAYAPSLCANLDLGDLAETQAIAPGGPLAQFSRSLLTGRSTVRFFPGGDFEQVKPDQLAAKYRWAATGAATIALEDGHLRIEVPEGGTGAISFSIDVKPGTSYRLTHAHWNDPAPATVSNTDEADAITRGEPPIAPRTRVIFRDAKGDAVTRNHWSGIGAHEITRQWDTFPHFILTPPETTGIGFTLFLQYPGTYLLDDVKIEELGGLE